MNLSLAGCRNRIIRAGRPSRAAAAGGVLVLGAALAVPAAASTHGPAAAVPAATRTTLTLTATTGRPDQTVGFTGAGYRDKERVAVHWRSARGTTLAKVTASRTGTIAGTFSVPLPRAGVTLKVTLVAVGALSKHEGQATFVQGCGDEWTRRSGGNWSNASSWSTGRVPGAATAACITLAGPKQYAVALTALTGSTTVGSLQVGAAGGKNTEKLAMNAGRSAMDLRLAHASTVYGHGVLLLTSAGGGGVITGPGPLKNYGLLSTIVGRGPGPGLNVDIVNEPGGTFRVGAGRAPASATSFSGNAALVNRGTLDVVKGAELVVGQAASLTQSGGHIVNSGIVDINGGTLTKSGGTSTGHAWQLTNGATLHDQAGTGAYTLVRSGTVTGTIAKGQTVTVVGGNGGNTWFQMTGDVTNYGAIVLTSTAYGGGGGPILRPVGAIMPTLNNYGTLETLTGAGYTRYFFVNVVNEATGIMELDGARNRLGNGGTIVNQGTLNLGAAAVLDLAGSSAGQANLTDTATATTGVVLGRASTSVIDQLGCPATHCQNEAITLAGTLQVTAAGPLSGAYYPIYSAFGPLAGGFAKVRPATDTVTYGTDATVPAAVDGVIVTP